MPADIGVRIGIEGEKTFKSALSGINAQLKNLSSEMKATVSAMSGLGDEEATAAKKSDILVRSIEASQQKIDILSQQYAKAEDKLEQLGQALEEAKRTFGENSAEAVKAQNAYNNQAAAVARLGTQINNATADMNRMEAELRDIASGADRAENALDGLGSEAGAVGDRMSQGFTVAKGALSSLVSAGISAAIEGIKNLASEALNSADSLTKFSGTMEFAGFSSKEIESSRKAVQDYAAKTVYDLETVSNTTAQLAANGIKDYNGLTQAAGNLNAVAGGNASTFQSVAQMLTQTAGAGKLTTENWNQLADAIPGASGKLQEAMKANGAYVGDFRDAMEKGEITADEFNQAIMDLGMTEAAKEAASSVSTFEGAMGNLQATIVDGMTALLTNFGGMELITGAISGLVTVLEGAGQIVGPALEGLKSAFTGLAQTFSTIFTPAQRESISGFFSGLASAIVGVPFAALSAALTVVVGAINAVLQVGAGLVTFFRETLPGGIQTAADWFGQFPGKVSTATSSALQSVTTWGGQMVSTMGTKASEAVSAAVNYLAQLPGQITSTSARAVSALAAWGGQMVSQAGRSMSQVVSSIGSTLQGAISQVTTIGGQIVQGLAQGIRNAASAVLQALKSVIDSAVNAAKAKLGIASPSKLFKTFGSYTMEGYAIGLKDSAKQATQAMSSVMGSVANTAANRLNNMSASITAPIPTAASQVATVGAGLVNGMQTAMSGAQGGGTYTINLMLPDGTALARYQLPHLIDVARANGTPILNPT